MAKKKKSKPSVREKSSRLQLQPVLTYVVLLAAIGVFIYFCFLFDLTQDDAFISFRYAENFLNGEGLVYNSGERVEGYTNFLWVILLALFKGLFGLSYLFSSRLMGVAAGCVIFVLLFYLIKYHFRSNLLFYFTAVSLLMLSNKSLPYWSIASLETAAFSCMILAALLAEYRRPTLTPALLVIATLLRPEGVIVFAVVFLHRLIREREIPWRSLGLYVVPLLPFAVFKITYYGSLFPNPYYAKSGVGLEYIITGLEYLWHFLSTVGIYGIIFVVPLLGIKKLWGRLSLLYLFLLAYVAYIVWVGGDVLKVYRFFVPIMPVLYLMFMASVFEMLVRDGGANKKVRQLAFVVVLLFAAGSYLLSRGHINAYWYAERNLISKMDFVSSKMKENIAGDFSLAVSTIGKTGYNLIGHRVIDMLGLTDSYIARNPEYIAGMESSWKERRFNNDYLLRQKPDLILFSTGYKPSAPAERALMLHSEFRRCYATVGFRAGNSVKVAFRRVNEIDMSRDTVHSEIGFVDELHHGYNRALKSEFVDAERHFRESRRLLNEDWYLLSLNIGQALAGQNKIDSAMAYFNEAIELKPYCWEARYKLAYILQLTGDSTAARSHYKILGEQHPWMFGSN